MFFGKNKKKTEPLKAPVRIDAHHAGMWGSSADMYAISAAAKAYEQERKSAFLLYDKKSDRGMSLIYSLDKYIKLRDEYNDAQTLVYEINQHVNKGAAEAFLDGRPENLQTILSRQQDFPEHEFERENSLAARMLIDILLQMPDAGIPPLALAKVPQEKQREILNGTLLRLVDGYKGDIEKTTAALLDAGADASCDSSHALAVAIHKGQSGHVIDTLLAHGANYQAALERMHQNATYYGEKSTKTAYDQYRRETEARLAAQQQRIQELEETVKELTKRKDKDAPTPDPAASDTPAQGAVEQQTHAAGFVKKFPHL